MLIESVKSYKVHLRSFIALLAALFGFWAGVVHGAECRISTSGWNQMHLATIALAHENGSTIQMRVRVADESNERAAGFQHICPEIINLSSILFVYEQPTVANYHMNNVHDALDIGFFDENGLLFKVTRMEPPGGGIISSNIYSSDHDILYALETKAGFFADNELRAGEVNLQFD